MRQNQGMTKVVVSAFIIGVFLLYSLIHARADAATLPSASTTSRSTTPSGNGSATPGTTVVPGARYKDGSFTGGVADAQWGYIQVKAIISGGKITDVQFLQYPNERNRSVEINSYADPQLTQEAIAAQSAQVDIVTGATDTSQAFIQSLSDALTQAQVG
jgi:uncharacterized protein with FMN-binding domain